MDVEKTNNTNNCIKKFLKDCEEAKSDPDFVEKKNRQYPIGIEKWFIENGDQYHISVSTFRRKLELFEKEGGGQIQVSVRGAKNTLSQEAEIKFTNYLKCLYNIGIPITKALMQNEVIQQIGIEYSDDVIEATRTIENCGGVTWLDNFTSRNNIFKVAQNVYTLERSKKAQPEIVLEYARSLIWLHARIMIHRAMAKGIEVPGWVLPVDSLARREDQTDHPISGELVVVNDRIIVSALNEELEYVSPKFRWNCDEKPLIPDSTTTNQYSFEPQANVVVQGRSKSCTLHFYVSASGEMVPPLIILNGESIPVEVAEVLKNWEDAAVTSTPKGYQVKSTFHMDLARVLHKIRKRKGSHGDEVPQETLDYERKNPLLLCLDGHGSHKSREAVSVAESFNCYVVISPSHCSTLVQPTDNGPNAFVERLYKQYYAIFDPAKMMTMKFRMSCIKRAFDKLEKNKKVICSSWSRSGQPSGAVQFHLIEPSRYSASSKYRSKSLPTITRSYLEHVFSLENISAIPESPVILPTVYRPKNENERKELVQEFLDSTSSSTTQQRFEEFKQMSQNQVHRMCYFPISGNVIMRLNKAIKSSTKKLEGSEEGGEEGGEGEEEEGEEVEGEEEEGKKEEPETGKEVHKENNMVIENHTRSSSSFKRKRNRLSNATGQILTSKGAKQILQLHEDQLAVEAERDSKRRKKLQLDQAKYYEMQQKLVQLKYCNSDSLITGAILTNFCRINSLQGYSQLCVDALKEFVNEYMEKNSENLIAKPPKVTLINTNNQ